MTTTNNAQEAFLFEHLPVELILHTFSFLTPQQLYAAFFGLNQFINEIIRSMRHMRLHVTENSLEEIQKLKLLPIQISSLVNRLPDFQFATYANLRSLTLYNGTVQQLNSIRASNFPKLKYLTISGKYCGFDMEALQQLSHVVYSNGFPCLKHWTVACNFTTPLNDKWALPLTVRWIELMPTTEQGFTHLLGTCSDVHCLKNDCSLSGDTLLRSVQCDLQQLYLKYLEIPSCTLPFLADILACTPNVTMLNISMNDSIDDLARILHLYVPKLTAIRCLVQWSRFEGIQDEAVFKDNIENMHPLFRVTHLRAVHEPRYYYSLWGDSIYHVTILINSFKILPGNVS